MFQSSFNAFLYGIYRIQFKCKDNNICYGNFHHIFVPGYMDAFIHGIYSIQFKYKWCKDNNICYKIFIIFLLQISWMSSFMVFI